MENNTEKARRIVTEIIYITIASVSKDGQPWNTPVYSAFDEHYNFFWASDQNGQHSKNIKENPNIFWQFTIPLLPKGLVKAFM